MHKFRKGLNLPIQGSPRQDIEEAPAGESVAIIATEYVGMKARMEVQVGDSVQRGQLLFEDRKNPGVLFTSPAAGTVTAINRGAKRALLWVVIELSDGEKAGNGASEHVSFENYTGKGIDELTADEIRALLTESGEWSAIRQRPFSKVPAVDSEPHALFINAMDTHPLAPNLDVIYDEHLEAFEAGITVLSKLTAGKTYLCSGGNSKITHRGTPAQTEVFDGPHPAGTSGLHIHTLAPASANRASWYVGLQDVVAIGKLFTTGQVFVERVYSLAGPVIRDPRLLRTRRGASTDLLTAGQYKDCEPRVIAGSVFGGRAVGSEADSYMGRFTNQVTVLAEGREREFLGWLGLGENRFSVIPAFFSKAFPNKTFAFTTNNMGSHRAIVPIGMYEKVMPMDIMPTFLLRSLAVGDLERAVELGCLELDEEDLALCSFVCPGKNDYGPMLRSVLTTIEKEG
ncbi:MAG: Na(+)-translocating NADH-quinone reductase subunit A [Myxococcota bacterium]|nr:Na(+)-translocating NADH-quinone reductase subunit A [Myxococcota bacterium]